MPFPTTKRLVDFRSLPDGGPPPSPDFGDTGLAGGGMVVDTGSCTKDPEAPGFGTATYITVAYNLPCEVWVRLNSLDGGSYAAVYVMTEDEATEAFLFWWYSGGDIYYALNRWNGGSYNLIWASTNEFPDLTANGAIGLRANADNTLELWISVDGNTWTLIHTETILDLPNPAKLGFGMFAVIG